MCPWNWNWTVTCNHLRTFFKEPSLARFRNLSKTSVTQWQPPIFFIFFYFLPLAPSTSMAGYLKRFHFYFLY